MIVKILTTEDDQQLILKPENEFEEKVCELFESLPNVYCGDFDECEGGYHRNFGEGKDLIIRFPNKKEKK